MARDRDALGAPGIGTSAARNNPGGFLLIIQVFNVYKPRGMTRYGQGKSAERLVAPAASA